MADSCVCLICLLKARILSGDGGPSIAGSRRSFTLVVRLPRWEDAFVDMIERWGEDGALCLDVFRFAPRSTGAEYTGSGCIVW